MIGLLDPIDILPQELAAALESDPFFADIPVVLADEGNVAQQMAAKQAVVTQKTGRRGVAVIVLPILADDEFPNLQFGPMTLRPAFQVIENRELNIDPKGTHKRARVVARKIRDVIKNLGLLGIVNNLSVGKPGIEPVSLGKDQPANLVVYQVNFDCLERAEGPAQAVQTPQFTGVTISGHPYISITSPTPNAPIWFTLDDSFPRPGSTDPDNPNSSQLYTEPIPIPANGFILRARGYPPPQAASGIEPQVVWAASWVQRAIITAS